MDILIYNPYNNTLVVNDYVAVIESALNKLGKKTRTVKALEKKADNKNKGIVVIAAKDATMAKKCGFKKVILWVQGVIPEESFMRNKSKIRSFILSHIERKGLKAADFILFVSKAMKDHYEKKYGIKTDDYYIMPCLNCEVADKKPFDVDGKYSNNLFIYAGSTEVWQCFDETVKLYSEIEKRIDNSFFRILTGDKEYAEKTAKEYGLKRYSIGYVIGEALNEELGKAKFGFCLRKDSVVNNVSTPTKLSTYISNGIIPIYSKYVYDFAEIMKDAEYGVCSYDANAYNIEKIIELCGKSISADSVYNEYMLLFGDYYSKQYHIEKMSEIIKERMQFDV